MKIKITNPRMTIARVCKSILKFLSVVVFSVIMTDFLVSQESSSFSLWNDRNPYSNSQEIKNGEIIQILFAEPIKAEYQSEYKSSNDHKIMSNPDKKMIEEMKGYESDQSIARNSNTKSKTSGRVIGKMAVKVTGFDTVTDNIEIEGRRESRFDNDRQVLSVRGTISRKDLGMNRTIDSARVANLEINYSAHGTPRNLQNPDVGLKPTTNPDGTTGFSANLSDTEKQELLLKYMKRMLGESGEEGSR
ncbi:flagellar basal body L-ring protein FlgH [Leptospira sp. GIMC2001]|uniref:flagellar basal body L-ring protein FlgH n=1 Tax=Leptospira sp. GIMC2001 TaxID=1513297 RepID=UPI0004A5C615|nr:flagellar basal body L-ring protein FlgH [Leptospira sp. GIMC2001]AID56244.1 flagellar L-ring protein FlgH [Leptospira sp. GIMC2001]WCL48082.1 flagellar basal body L-ring protein FlgH [Leptospira sp. GIMC2001]